MSLSTIVVVAAKSISQHCRRRLFQPAAFTQQRQQQYHQLASFHHQSTTKTNVATGSISTSSYSTTVPTTSTTTPLYRDDDLPSRIEEDDFDDGDVDQYFAASSSFEAALNQVLELQRNYAPSASGSTATSCHQHSLETCVRDFFRIQQEQQQQQ